MRTHQQQSMSFKLSLSTFLSKEFSILLIDLCNLDSIQREFSPPRLKFHVSMSYYSKAETVNFEVPLHVLRA